MDEDRSGVFIQGGQREMDGWKHASVGHPRCDNFKHYGEKASMSPKSV